MTDFDAASDVDEEHQNELLMPEKVNLHEAVFAAPNIQELNAKQAKAHVTFGRKAATTAISLFALLTFVIDTQIPCRPSLDNPIRWNRIFNRYGEVDEHCDGTLIHIHHLVLATDALNMRPTPAAKQ
eukprot:scaffold42830_cov222-Skeletonema_dohrnii-CCMP3373.AAC.2